MGFATVLGQVFFVLLFFILLSSFVYMDHVNTQKLMTQYDHQRQTLLDLAGTNLELETVSYASGVLSLRALNTGELPVEFLDVYVNERKVGRPSLSICRESAQCGESGYGDYAFETTGLSSLYHFNNDSFFGESGALVADVYGTRDLTATGLTYDSGKYGLAAQVTSATSLTGATLSFDALNSYTWNMWVRPLSATEDGVLMSATDFSTSGISLFLQNGVVFAQEYATDQQISGSNLQTTWHMVTLRYDAGDVTLFVDGLPIAAGVFGSAVSDLVSPFYIVPNSVLGGNDYLGFIDEASVYTTDVSDNDIATLYAKGRELYNERAWDPLEAAETDVRHTLAIGSYVVKVTTPSGVSSVANLEVT